MAESTEPIVAPDADPAAVGERFAEFYKAVHDRTPFAWQMRLAAEVLSPANGDESGWPEVISVPTGCGKTSILDIAVFQLAVQASRHPQVVTAARRVCLVVDRKLIVDEATDHAAKIRRKIFDTKDPLSILGRIAASLRSLAPHHDQAKHDPLRVVRLRGGVYRDEGWAAEPLTPTIILSTVDQIGSRLLFRGYGVSRRARAVHAGLLAFDTRIILDEAHLSTVFATTIMGRKQRSDGGNGTSQRVAGIRPYQQWAEQSVLLEHRRLRITRMSATAGTPSKGERAFQLSVGERHEASIMPRLEAKKPAALIEVPVEDVKKAVRDTQPRAAREIDRKNREKLVGKMVEHARKVAGIDQKGASGRPIVVGLVFNRVASARQAFNELREHSQSASTPESSSTLKHEVILLTGRIRPLDRDRLLKEWLPKIEAGRNAQPDRPLFVVATQTVEVGANIDFDALITEAAPLDALRQRCGRLHRIPDQPPSRPAASAAVFIQSDHAKDSSADPLYGSAVAETWKWLNSGGVATKPATTKKSNGRRTGKATSPPANESTPPQHPQLDFASANIDRLLADDKTKPANLSKFLAPQPEAPILFPAHLDAWAQTSLHPDPDPDVAPFLHGPGSGNADVQIVWRADLTPRNCKHWPEVVALMPPRTREALAVPLHEARAWLLKMPAHDDGDIEGAATHDVEATGRGRSALRWRGSEESRVITPTHLRAGDTIVVPAWYGGADEFGWVGTPQTDSRGKTPKPTPVPDVADQCLAELVASYPPDAFHRPELRVRLHPQLLRPLPIEMDNDETKKEEKKEILDARKKVKALLPPIASAATSEKNVAEALQKALRSWPIATLSVSTLGVPCAALGEAIKSARVHSYPDSSGVVVSARIPLQNTTGSIHDHDLEFDEPDDDRASMHDGGNPVTLDDHTRAVVKTADTFARASALPDNLRAALEAAAYWHDQGKRDRRFQAWLHGSELAAFAALAEKPPRVLAKSARPTNGNALSSARFSYPKGHRHEFVSVRLFEKAGTRALRIPSHNSTTLTVTAEDADLVKFLIGTHHGRGRAFAPVSRDRHPVRISMDHDGARIEVSSDHALHTLDSGWSDLFWSLLRRYGWWGLAYLEAILITADHHVSASEQRPAAHSMTEAGAASSPSPSKSLAPIQPNLEASLQPNLPFSRATSAGSTTR